MQLNTLTSTLPFTRSPEERRDPFLSWQRDDSAFFASGACHVLAFLFVQIHQHEGFRIEFLRPRNHDAGTHVFASDGDWCFDFNGWSLRNEFLEVNEHDYRSAYAGWSYDLIVVNEAIETFCLSNGLRTPQNFFHMPWVRAYHYIARFPPKPPDSF